MNKFNQSILTGLSVAALGLLAFANLSAQSIVQFDFNTNLSATTEDANLTASGITVGSGITGANRSGSSNSLFARASVTHSSNQLSIGNAIVDNDYFSFTVDVDAGYEMDLTSFQFDLGYTRNGSFDGKQFKAYLLTSIDGFVDAGDIVGSETITVGANTGTATYPNGTTTISLSATQYQDISSTTEFRIYIADNTGGTDYVHRIDNVTLNGTVSAVIPEPGTYALLGGLFVFGTVLLRRRFMV